MQYNQKQQPSFRELLIQIVNTLKHSFDQKVHTSTFCQSEEIANARLSQFEKTYVSFPEFVDITTTVETNNSTRKLYDQPNKPQQWHKHSSALTC
jgi:hypothetical protein